MKKVSGMEWEVVRGGVQGEFPDLIRASYCLLHDPGDEAGSGKPVAQGLDEPHPEAIALIDLEGPVLAAPGSFPDPVVRSEGFDIVAPSGFHIVAFEIDEAFAHLLAANDFVGAFGGVRHCRSVEDWRGGEKRKR